METAGKLIKPCEYVSAYRSLTVAIPMQDYHIRAITSFEDMGVVLPLWEASDPQPGTDYEFFRLMFRDRPGIICPCVLAVFREETPVSLWLGRIETAKMPVRLGYSRLAEISVKQLVFISRGWIGDTSDEIQAKVLAFMEGLLVKQKLDMAIVENVDAESSLVTTTSRILTRAWLCPVQDKSEVWLLQLASTWDDFLKSRSKKHRYWLKRLRTNLDRDFAGRWEIKIYSSTVEAGDFVKAAEVVARTTYQRGLGVGFRLNDAALGRAELDARRGQLRSYVLWIDGEPRAFWYCFVHQQTLYLAATGYNPTMASYELGTVLLMRIFQDHCGTNVKTVNFGLGDAGYKRRFASDHLVLTTLYVFPKTFRGFRLNALRTTAGFSSRFVKAILDRLRITQRLKTAWRRRIRPEATGTVLEATK